MVNWDKAIAFSAWRPYRQLRVWPAVRETCCLRRGVLKVGLFQIFQKLRLPKALVHFQIFINSKRFNRGSFSPMAAVSIRGQLKHGDVPNRRKIGWVLESIRKYAVDFSVNFSKKGEKGLPQLHKTVQEELKDGAFLKVCNDREKQKLDTISRSENEMIKTEKTQEEMNVMKLKNGISAEQLDPISLNKFPPEQVKKNNILNPNRKRIMIRSRL